MNPDAYNDHLGNPALPTTLARKTPVCGYFKCKRYSTRIRPLPRNKALDRNSFSWPCHDVLVCRMCNSACGTGDHCHQTEGALPPLRV